MIRPFSRIAGWSVRRRILTAFLLLALAAVLILLPIALDDSIHTVCYTLTSAKITDPVRLALVTDYHSCDYGEGASELVSAIEAADPDALLLVGDIFDDVMPHDRAFEFTAIAAKRWPCFYVTGNHEIWSGEAEMILETLKGCGITVLSGDTAAFTVGATTLTIGGLDDPDRELWQDQLVSVCEDLPKENFAILLSHRPERAEMYRRLPYDLVLCGHAHGGQWRIPGLLNGLYAPHQGLFPRYAGGRYDSGDQTMIVSRGLARETTPVPRIFNRPELVILELLPSGE